MCETKSERKPRQSSQVGKNFEQALARGRAQNQEKVKSLKKQNNGETFTSITGRWSNALEGSKEYENMKIKAVKRNSINVSEGFVSSRVTQLEQCVMQAQASAEQIANMLHRLLNISSSDHQQVLISSTAKDVMLLSNTSDTDPDMGADQTALPFKCNNTTSYHFDHNSATSQHLNTILLNNGEQPIALSCGVFMSSADALQQVTTRPEVIALAMRDSDTQEPYIALTINSPIDSQNQSTACSGPMTVAFFLPSHGTEEDEEGDEEEQEVLWEATFDIMDDNSQTSSAGIRSGVSSEEMNHEAEDTHSEIDNNKIVVDVDPARMRTEGDEDRRRLSETLTGDGSSIVGSGVKSGDDEGEDDDETSNSLEVVDGKQIAEKKGKEKEEKEKEEGVRDTEILLNMSINDSEASFGRGRGDYVSDSDSAVDEGEDVWLEVGAGKDNSLGYDTDVSSVATSSQPNTPLKQAFPSPVFSLEGGLPEIRNNVKRTVSVNEMETQHLTKLALETAHLRTTALNNIITMDSEPMRSPDHDNENDDTATEQIRSSNVATDINAFDIILASASHKMLIIKNRGDSHTTVISTDSVNHYLQETTISASSTLAISNNTLVEWTRAVALSGYCTKWPMQNQKVHHKE